MSFDEEPPRLRGLGHELPRELELALESSPDEDAVPAELRLVHVEVKRTLRVTGRASGVFPWPGRRSAAFQRTFALAMTFALGAGAGVAASGGLVLVQRLLAPSKGEHSAGPGAVEPSGVTPSSARATVAAERPALAPAAPDASATEPTALSAARVAPPSSAPRHEDVAASTAAASASPSTAAKDELLLLARAQEALALAPSETLALSAAHEQEFPHGSLVQEREVLAIDALMRLGRKSEAEARALRFHRAFPASAHGRRVDVLVGAASADSRHN